jgi:hypothetical protein
MPVIFFLDGLKTGFIRRRINAIVLSSFQKSASNAVLNAENGSGFATALKSNAKSSIGID